MGDALVIGLDVGTTGCKGVALGVTGKLCGTASTTYALHTDASGRAEQDAGEIWRAVCSTLEALSQELAGTRSDTQVAGLALSGAMHSLLPLDAEREPLGYATTWADSRASALLNTLRRESEPRALYARTGCPLQGPYHPARLRWLAREAPELFKAAELFVSLKDWLLYKLTGQLLTDLGLASSTGLLDLRRATWSEAALALAGVSRDRLPELAPPTQRAGGLTSDAAALTGFARGLPVVVGSSDGGLANLGSGVRRAGEAVVTVGTSGAVRRVADAPLLDPEMRTWCYLLDEGRFFAGGAINNGGLALEWTRRTLYSELPEKEGFKRLLAEAEASDADDLLFLPYFTGERSPLWNARLRASLYGLGDHHTRSQVARAALEGVAFCLADVWELVGTGTRPVKLTGGITRSRFWSQVVTDVLGVPMKLSEVADASALGAAMLGQVALGHADLETFPVGGEAPELLTPDGAAHARYAAKRPRFRALYRATEAITEDLRE